MSILRRDDGLQFIIHSYREILKADRTGALKGKIRTLAHEHGNNLCIFQTLEHDIEVVFARDSGFLLGESVWNFLNKPKDLIYCEALFEHNYALMVIVKDGAVLLDGKIPYSEVVEELAALDTTRKYDIYVYGDVPVNINQQISENFVKSFTKLESSLLMKLPMYDKTRLQPLELALTSSYFGKSGISKIMMIIFAIVIGFIGWQVSKFFLFEPIKQQVVEFKKIEDPFLNFYFGLAKPYPEEQINEFISMENLISTLPPGWKIKKVVFDGQRYNMEIFSENGAMGVIRNWMTTHDFKFSFKTNAIPITVKSDLKPRPRADVVYFLDDVLTVVVDRTTMMLDGVGNVVLDGISNKGDYKEAVVSVHVDKVFGGMLSLIGNELNRLPVSIDHIEMKIEDGLYSGDVKIKVFGD